MNDFSLKQLIQEMSLEGALEVVSILRDRPDIASILVTTQKEMDEMDAYYKTHFEELMGVKNEPA
jgi:hypothetical protein